MFLSVDHFLTFQTKSLPILVTEWVRSVESGAFSRITLWVNW